MALLKLFLCMMFVSCNGLLLASQQIHERFNLSINNYINQCDIGEQVMSDDDKKFNQRIAAAVEYLRQHRQTVILPEIISEFNINPHADKVAKGIAFYYRIHRDVAFNNQYALHFNGFRVMRGRESFAQFTLSNLTRRDENNR